MFSRLLRTIPISGGWTPVIDRHGRRGALFPPFVSHLTKICTPPRSFFHLSMVFYIRIVSHIVDGFVRDLPQISFQISARSWLGLPRHIVKGPMKVLYCSQSDVGQTFHLFKVFSFDIWRGVWYHVGGCRDGPTRNRGNLDYVVCNRMC